MKKIITLLLVTIVTIAGNAQYCAKIDTVYLFTTNTGVKFYRIEVPSSIAWDTCNISKPYIEYECDNWSYHASFYKIGDCRYPENQIYYDPWRSDVKRLGPNLRVGHVLRKYAKTYKTRTFKDSDKHKMLRVDDGKGHLCKTELWVDLMDLHPYLIYGCYVNVYLKEQFIEKYAPELIEKGRAYDEAEKKKKLQQKQQQKTKTTTGAKQTKTTGQKKSK